VAGCGRDGGGSAGHCGMRIRPRRALALSAVARQVPPRRRQEFESGVISGQLHKPKRALARRRKSRRDEPLGRHDLACAGAIARRQIHRERCRKRRDRRSHRAAAVRAPRVTGPAPSAKASGTTSRYFRPDPP
jgi:hypothetical protein